MQTVPIWLLAMISSAVAIADEAPTISPGTTDEHGFLVHEVVSAFQEGKTEIRVLLPDGPSADRRLPAIYILPVEAKNESRYGDGLLEVKKHDLHNKHGAIFVAPTFAALPWYADHPTDPRIQQET